MWDRIARIHDQINNDLRHLAGVESDVRAVGRAKQVAFDGDVFADEPQQGTLEIGDERIDVDYPRIKRVFAAERE